MEQLTWLEIYDVIRGQRKVIGWLGFIDRKWVCIQSGFDDWDGNRDGRLSRAEWAMSYVSPISMKGNQIATVAFAASLDPKVFKIDPEFAKVGQQARTAYFAQLVIDQTFALYWKGPVGKLAGSAASGIVQQFVVKKGAETIVQRAFEAMTK